MTQEIKLGVSAQTSGAAAGIENIGKATQGVADAAENIAKQTKAAADNMTRLEQAARRLASVQSILSKEFGKPVDGADATLFLHNFEKMRGGSSLFGRSLRRWDSFENWYSGHGTAYGNAAGAARHRRTVFAVGMQNTGYSQDNGTPGFPPAPPPRKPPSGMSSLPGAGAALSVGKGMLAIAGLGSMFSIASKAVDSAASEGIGIDTLKRKMGDLGVSYDSLRDNVRSAAEGFGLTYVEATKLAQQMAKISGNFNGGDLRTSIGFARSFGLDPEQTGGFFASMRQIGAQGSADQDSRKFASLIADAIERGGWPAKADEVLQAVQSFAATVVRSSLSRPNVPEFAAYLSGMTSMGGDYGLTPDVAGGILSQANSSFMRGGGRGQASMNFIYQALARSNPSMNPLMFQQLMEGGIFGSAASVFGTGVGAQYFGPMSGLNGQSNFEASKAWMLKQYPGDSQQAKALRAQAMSGLFGVSMGQAEALLMMSPTNLGQTQSLIGRAGLQMSDINGSAYSGLAQIAAAKNMAGLSGLAGATLQRSDISDSDKEMIRRAMNGGDFEKAQDALTRVVGTHAQEDTDGAKTRATLADLQNVITRVGADLLAPINDIRAAITFLAGKQGWTPSPLISGKDGSFIVDPVTGMVAPMGKFSLSNNDKATLAAVSGGDPWMQQHLYAWLATENRGFGYANTTARNKKSGAYGAFQFMPSAWHDFGDGSDLYSSGFGAQAAAASKMMTWLHQKYGNNDSAIAAYLDGGGVQAAYAAAGQKPPASETQDYLKYYLGNLNGQVPADGKASGGNSAVDVNLRLGGEVRLPVTDQNGTDIGGAYLRPYAAPYGAIGAGLRAQ